MRRLLKDSDIHPAQDKAFKKPVVPWTTFVHALMDFMVGCDLLAKRVYTLRGFFTAYMLVFIHLPGTELSGPRQAYYDQSHVVRTGDPAAIARGLGGCQGGVQIPGQTS